MFTGAAAPSTQATHDHPPGEQSIAVHAGWDEEEDQIKVTPPLPQGGFR